MEPRIALKVHDDDNVATIFAQGVQSGMRIEVCDKKGMKAFIRLADDIPYGHKIAIKSIGRGSPVKKYGEEIGLASMDIEPGEHVHVHNLESNRGRGDL